MSSMPVPVGGTPKIGQAVGRGAPNVSKDVTVVQQLINQCIGLLIPRAPLTANGTCDSATIEAIIDFQGRVVKMASPDGRVDPGGTTLGALSICASGKPFVPKSAPSPAGDGHKYTDSPNEVVTTRTTPSAGDVVAMLLQSWPELNENGARTLTAQFMGETGDGKFCFNWNLGNVKAGAGDRHMYLRNVWECSSVAGAQTQVDNAKGLAHIATEEEIKQHGWKCPGAVVVYQPPHAQCRFRAYGSLVEGAAKWLTHHQKIALHNPTFLTSLNAGDTAAVAHALKLAGYYTASEADYARIMKQKKLAVDRQLGPS